MHDVGCPHSHLMVGRPLTRDPHFSSIFYQVRSGCSAGGLSQGSKPSKKVIPSMQVVFKSLFALGLLIFHWLEQVTWPTHIQRVMIQTSTLKGGSQITRGRICGHFNFKHEKIISNGLSFFSSISPKKR